LKPLGYTVRQIAQEHSFIPAMWQRLTHPDVLICLEASYPVTKQRKRFNWSEKEYQQQIERLRHAQEHADLRVDTDDLTPGEVLSAVLEFLGEK
jgi:hypothetical protein